MTSKSSTASEAPRISKWYPLIGLLLMTALVHSSSLVGVYVLDDKTVVNDPAFHQFWEFDWCDSKTLRRPIGRSLFAIQFEFLGDGGMPIGLLPDIDFQQSEFRMAPGDRLLLYSDGLTECQMKDGNMLEEHGLLDLVRTVDAINGQDFLDDLYSQLTHNMHPEHGAADDVSATLFEYQGPEPDS